MGAKNCPESARQKMINMMYLVLTAMLALNVAAETLDAFRIVDKSLMKTYLSFSDKNESLIADFRSAYDINQDKVEKWLELANSVHAQSDSLVRYIIDTKEVLSIKAGAHLKEIDEEVDEGFAYIKLNNGDTIVIESQDDLNATPEIMLTKGRGKELQQFLIQYKLELKDLVKDYPSIIENLNSSLDVEDPDRSEIKIGDENYRTWAEQNFLHTPVIASITLLSKLQIDVRNAESAVLRHLFNQIDASSFKFTGLKATVIPDASYIFQGQEYKAHIFLSAEDSTQQLEVFVNGSDKPLPLDGNEAIYSFTPDKPGVFTYKGEIKYRNPDGDGFSFKSFEREFQVAKPNATVSATKMNVLFKNLQNPISISVPGVSSDKIQPVCTNGNMYADGENWMIEPEELDPTGANTKIIVFAEIDGEKRQMYETAYRVMKVPDPKAQVNGIASGAIAREVLRLQSMVSAKLEGFYFDLRFEVTSFDMSIPTSGGYTTTLHSDSYSFTDDQKRLLNGLVAGNKVFIENINAKITGDEDDVDRQLSPIILTVQ
ncbi:MAG: gliding motility protein GldM [Prolixibacteraceae bacterium]|jgi:gliding motility-associated protein GldM|nr:gliding motility protein GldM [Prolixibacteraceae bacterium]